MAFEEIKAKLGLDITAFQQNASKAQGALKTLTREATKKFTDMKQVGQAAATALGINYQAIADGIARFVIGFSKDQEQALNDLVDATDKAADAQEAAFKRAQDARKKLLQDIADKEEEYRRSQLTDDERSNELGKRLGEIMTERNKLEKQGFQTSDRYLQLKNEQLDVEKELRGLEDKKAKNDADALTAQEQITKELEEGVAEVVSMLIDKQAELEDQDKARTAELKKQRGELEAQARLKAEEIRAARIQDVKPTMEEVTSGKRNIGGRAFTAATALQQERENSIRLADQVQRDAEALDAAKGFNERAKAEAAFNASRAALFASQQRIKRGQEFLGNRVKDANPYATMEQELSSIKTELTKLNTQTLNPKAIK